MSASSISARRTARFAQLLPCLLRSALPLLALLLAGLSGCKEQAVAQKDLKNVLHPVEVTPLNLHANPLTANMRDPLSYDPRKVSLADAVPDAEPIQNAKADPVENAHAVKYYAEISDAYWKLNWMRKELLHGSVPYNMLDEIEKARKKLKTVTHDGNYVLAEEALERMEKGLEHLACLRILRAAQIDDRRVPWEAGAAAVQQYLDQTHSTAEASVIQAPQHVRETDNEEEDGATHRSSQPNFPDTTPGAATLAHRQAIGLVLDYETRYHTSPRTLMEQEWQTAIRRTNRLRDNLFLQDRAENNDGDGTDISLAVSIAAGDYGSIHTPRDAGQDGTAPTMVDIAGL